MKKDNWFIIILITLILFSGKNLYAYSIKGNLIGFQDGTKIFLLKYLTDEPIDSAIVNQNTFNMNGSFDAEPELFILTTENIGHHIYHFYLADEDIQIVANCIDFPKNHKITGSRLEDDKNVLKSMTKDLYERRMQLVSEYYSLPVKENNPKSKLIWDTIAVIDKNYSETTISFIRKNPDSYISIIHLVYEMKNIDKDDLRLIFNSLSSKLQNSTFAKSINLYLNDKILKIGDSFFDFEAYNIQNEKVKFSNFQKDYVLLDFTSYSCLPCIASVKELKEVQSLYSKNLDIVSFYIDNKRNDWAKAINRDSISWSSLWDGLGQKSSTYINYGVSGVPKFILFYSGKIIDMWSGYGKDSIKNRLNGKIK